MVAGDRRHDDAHRVQERIEGIAVLGGGKVLAVSGGPEVVAKLLWTSAKLTETAASSSNDRSGGKTRPGLGGSSGASSGRGESARAS
uniref:DUF834 domain-containing protein n=1 Tax=Oryza meyeriana var. granulata TaxID=110450 RepID=A0A1V1H7U1_9ORYZ|nr:hypothetical protein [Oryza meyeriana var. granulata]